MSLQGAAVSAARFVRPQFVAERYQLKESTLAKWRMIGKGPRYAKLGGRVVYDLNDVELWVEAQKRASETAGA